MSRRKFDPCLPITRQRKDAVAPKLAGRLSLPPMTFRTSSKINRSKVKVTRPLTAVTKNHPYLRNGKACMSPLLGGGGILWRPQYRPHSFFVMMELQILPTPSTEDNTWGACPWHIPLLSSMLNMQRVWKIICCTVCYLLYSCTRLCYRKVKIYEINNCFVLRNISRQLQHDWAPAMHGLRGGGRGG